MKGFGFSLAVFATLASATIAAELDTDVSLLRTDVPAQATNQFNLVPRLRSLFNGKDFSGWTFYMRTNADPTQTWSISNGVIQCTGKPNGYLRTKEKFAGYKVTVEWRFTKPGNTGVLVHMQDPDKVWPRTIECQGAHNQQGDFWMQGGATCKDHTTSDTRRVPKREESNEKPVGEWNTCTVECEGTTVRIYVNGKLMNEALECNVEGGYIGIQSEGAAFEIRKIEIEPTKGTKDLIQKVGGGK